MSRSKLGNRELDLDLLRLDLSDLVGHAITLYSEQYTGKPVSTRVLAAADQRVQIDAGGPTSMVANLVNHQTVVLRLPYRGQDLSVRAQLSRSSGGRCYLLLDSKAMPLSQRRFQRVPLIRTVRLATIPIQSMRAHDIARLRWVETGTLNFSSGGLLIELPSGLSKDVLMFLNLELESSGFPRLILGQVRHCFSDDVGKSRAGVEFIIREYREQIRQRVHVTRLPAAVFSYSRADRDHLNQLLANGQLTIEE